MGLTGKFVAGYVGTIGMAHGLGTLLDAAVECEQKRPDVAFLVVGEGAHREQTLGEIAKRGLTNVRVLGQQPRERVADLIRLSDACLVLLKKAEVFRTVIPTKMLEFMACGRPVVLGVEGQAREILEAAGAGIAVEPENVAALCGALDHLRGDPWLGRSLGRAGRQYIEANLSRESTAQAYLEVLERLAGRGMERRTAAAPVQK